MIADVPVDPDGMSPDERRAEISSLLAAGFLRLRADQRRATAHQPDESPVTASLSNSQEGLDNAPETSVHVAR